MAGAPCSHHRQYTAGCYDYQRLARRYGQRVRAAQTRGEWKPVRDAQPVRDHIQQLRATGMTITGIARHSGIPESTIASIIHEPRVYLHGHTAEALLATQPGPTPRAGEVPAVATVRRLQALVADGHSMLALARMLDRSVQTVWLWANDRKRYVHGDTDRAVADLYDRLALEPGGNVRARNLAARNGWAPREAWTEDTISDPDAVPAVAGEGVDVVLVDRVLNGRESIDVLNPSERVELWRAWYRRWRASGNDGAGTGVFGRQFGLSSHMASKLRGAAAQADNTTPTCAASAV